MKRLSGVWFALLLTLAVLGAWYEVRYRGKGLSQALLEVGLLTALPILVWVLLFPGWPRRSLASTSAPAQDARIIRVFRRRRIIYLLLVFSLVLWVTALVFLTSRMFPYGVFGAEGTIGGVPISSFFLGPAFAIFLGLLAVLLLVAFVFFFVLLEVPCVRGIVVDVRRGARAALPFLDVSSLPSVVAVTNARVLVRSVLLCALRDSPSLNFASRNLCR